MRQTKEQSLMTDMTVARTILDQLGGARFVAMTGAREFVGSADSLTFKIGVNPKRVSQVRVTLTPAHLYSVTFFRMARRRRSKATSIATCSKRCVFRAHRPLHAIAAAGRIMNETVREASKIGPCAEHSRLSRASTQPDEVRM
jgi:hypothetical protein